MKPALLMLTGGSQTGIGVVRVLKSSIQPAEAIV